MKTKILTILISRCHLIFWNSTYYNSNNQMINSTLFCSLIVTGLFPDYPLNRTLKRIYFPLQILLVRVSRCKKHQRTREVFSCIQETNHSFVWRSTIFKSFSLSLSLSLSLSEFFIASSAWKNCFLEKYKGKNVVH